MTSNKDMPAMPLSVDMDESIDAAGKENEYRYRTGLTKREHFCLKMGVANTGDEELDAIIRKVVEQKFAGLAMQGLLANPVMGDSDLHSNHRDWVEDMTSTSIEFAKALLSQLEDKGDD
jgi:hypothetical protein